MQLRWRMNSYFMNNSYLTGITEWFKTNILLNSDNTRFNNVAVLNKEIN